MRSKNRHHRPKHRCVTPWPDDGDTPRAVADRARYVGSSEHKGSWSPLFNPRLRSDASECPPDLSGDLDVNTQHLRRGIIAQCVGRDFEDGFPRYVWVWVDGDLYEARHMRGPVGTYKAYPLEPVEKPLDRHGRLDAARQAEEAADEP